MISAYRIKSLIGSFPQFSLQKSHIFSPFSAASSKLPNFSTEEEDGAGNTETGSAVYQHMLKTQRPSSIVLPWKDRHRNSVSLIGSVDRDLDIYQTKDGILRAYTLLNVKNRTQHDSNRTFRMRVEVLDDMAKMCIQHLKPNDFIHVLGHLESNYIEDRKKVLCSSICKVVVNELYYVALPNQSSTCQNHEEKWPRAYKKDTSQESCQNTDKTQLHASNLEEKKAKLIPVVAEYKASQEKKDETGMEIPETRLYLWQLFFHNPHEWWDNRKDKKYPRSPDFKHKDTGEALWLRLNDPPWVKRQLQLLDLKLAEQYLGSRSHSHSRRSRVSEWMFDE